MGELRTFRGGKSEDEPGCDWCHKDYPCHGKGHTSLNCPRVEELQFLPGSEAYSDAAGNVTWDISAVRFKRPLEFECDPDEATGEPDAETA